MSMPPHEGANASSPSNIPMPPEVPAESDFVAFRVDDGRWTMDDGGERAIAHSPSSIVRVNWWEPTYVFFITLIIFGLLTPRFVAYLDPVTGDEPFYLMTAISILQDHDLNECNNYRQRDEAALYPPLAVEKNILPHGWVGWAAIPYPLPPHPAKIVPESRRCLGTNVARLVRGIPGVNTPLPANGTQNELYSKHGLGLALLATLPFALGGRTLVALFLNILGALLAANIYLFARESTGKKWIGVLTWLAFTFTVPFMPYSFLIFPEMPAALLIVYAFRRIWLMVGSRVRDEKVGRGARPCAPTPSPYSLLPTMAIGLCIAFLPWLHYRFIPVSAGLFAFFVYALFRDKERSRDDRLKQLSPLLAPIIISAICLMAYFYFLYRHIWPNLEDHAGLNDFDGTLRGIAGSLLDAQWGLFVYAPIYILAIVGIILMAAHRRWQKDLLWVGIVFVPYFLVIDNYAQWWGEWCPPARYLTSVLPLMALPFAVALDKIRSPMYKGIYGLLLLLSLLVMVGFTYQPRWMYNQPDGTSVLFSRGLAEVITNLPADIADKVPSKMQPYIDEKISDKREQLVVKTFGWFPTFVVPYFAYTLEDQDSGDYWVEQAWKHSAWPFIAISLIVVVCLLLALWEMRKIGNRVRDEGVAYIPPSYSVYPAAYVSASPEVGPEATDRPPPLEGQTDEVRPHEVQA